MYMPVPQEALNLSLGSGAENVPKEKVPLVPMIGSNGELVYYIQGSVPGVSSIPKNTFTGLHPEINQNSVFSDKRFLQQQNPNGFLSQLPYSISCQNGTSTSVNSLIKSMDFGHNETQFAAAGFSTNRTPQLVNPVMIANFQASTKTNIAFSSCSLNGTTSNLQSNKLTTADTTAALLGRSGTMISGSVNLVPEATSYHQIAKSPLSNQQGVQFETQTTEKEYGPVEKAVFNQAMSNHFKHRVSSSKVEATTSTTNKNLSDLKAKGGKHSRGMFEQQIVKGGSTGLDNISFLSKSLNENFSNPRSPTLSNPVETLNSNILQRTVVKVPKPVSIPAIRYHPYTKTEEKTVAGPKSDCSLQPQKLTGSIDNVDSDKNCTSSDAKALSSSVCNKISSVFSVSVPRTGSYVVNNSYSSIKVELTEAEVEPDPATLDMQHAEITETISNESKNDVTDDDDDKSTKALVCDAGSNESSPQQDSDSPITSRPTCESSSPPPLAVREVHLPNPLPPYITKVDKPPSRVLKESLHCTTCDVYVNSENQMKQHINSLRHKNTLQGIPTPPKPGREEKPKVKSDQYRCQVCKVTLNSDIQLSQHLASQRHKNMLEGKPPKPRWSPYDRIQPTLMHSSTALRLPYKTMTPQSLLTAAQPPSNVVASSVQNGLPTLNGFSTLPPGYLNTAGSLSGPTQLKQTSIMLHDGGLLQAREIVYVGASQVPGLQHAAAYATHLPQTLPAVMAGQQQVQLPSLIAHQPPTLDWLTSGGLRLAT